MDTSRPNASTEAREQVIRDLLVDPGAGANLAGRADAVDGRG